VARPTIQVDSIAELRKVEHDAVARLSEAPRSAHLFLMDPVGALASVGIVLSREAVAEWGELVGESLPAIPQQTRDLLLRSTGGMQIEVRIQGILPPGPGMAGSE
jgi:hypothetical protein